MAGYAAHNTHDSLLSQLQDLHVSAPPRNARWDGPAMPPYANPAQGAPWIEAAPGSLQHPQGWPGNALPHHYNAYTRGHELPPSAAHIAQMHFAPPLNMAGPPSSGHLTAHAVPGMASMLHDGQVPPQVIGIGAMMGPPVDMIFPRPHQAVRHNALYKTELCRSFSETGYCKYKERCQFAHGPGELRNISRHPRYKTTLCRTYHTSGTCPYGPRCHFIHNIEEAQTPPGYPIQVPPGVDPTITEELRAKVEQERSRAATQTRAGGSVNGEFSSPAGAASPSPSVFRPASPASSPAPLLQTGSAARAVNTHQRDDEEARAFAIAMVARANRQRSGLPSPTYGTPSANHDIVDTSSTAAQSRNRQRWHSAPACASAATIAAVVAAATGPPPTELPANQRRSRAGTDSSATPVLMSFLHDSESSKESEIAMERVWGSDTWRTLLTSNGLKASASSQPHASPNRGGHDSQGSPVASHPQPRLGQADLAYEGGHVVPALGSKSVSRPAALLAGTFSPTMPSLDSETESDGEHRAPSAALGLRGADATPHSTGGLRLFGMHDLDEPKEDAVTNSVLQQIEDTTSALFATAGTE